MDNPKHAERKRGVEQLVDFLTKTVSIEGLCQNKVVEQFHEIQYADFIKLLGRLNGIVRHIPIAKREILTPTESAKALGVGPFSTFVFAPIEERQRLMEETFNGMRDTAVSTEPNHLQVVARTLFTIMAYLHPAKDGNGRTARALYFLTSPHVLKDPKTLKSNLASILAERPYGIDEFIKTVNTAVFFDMIQARGIQHGISPDTDVDAVLSSQPKAIALKLPRVVDSYGFDEECMRLIAACDVMTKKQYERYGESSVQNPTYYSLSWTKLPRAVQRQAAAKLPEVRTEFLERILQASLDPDQDWKRFGIAHLDRGCGAA